MQISLVPIEGLGIVWPRVREMLRPATDRTNGRYSVDDIRPLIHSGQCLLWVALADTPKDKTIQDRVVAALVTRITRYPGRTLLSSLFLGGDGMKEWGPVFYSTIEDWARKSGCDGMETMGRIGWRKLLIKRGWSPLSFLFEKDF